MRRGAVLGHRLGPAMIVAASTLAAGCGSPERPPAWSEVDSAGVRVVTSAPPAVQWRLQAEPALSLGTVEGEGAALFFDVRDVELLGQDRVAVANRGSESVRVFDMNGSLVLEFGQAGHGPGDFTRLSMVAEKGDSLVTYDEGNDRIGVRSADGVLRRTFRLEWFAGLLEPVALGDSTILTNTVRGMAELHGNGSVVDSVLVSRYGYDGALLDSLGRIPGYVRTVASSGIYNTVVDAPFTDLASFVDAGGGTCWVFGPAPEVRCLGPSGALREIARVDMPPRPVTEQDVAAFWAEVETRKPSMYREAQLRVRKNMTFPEAFPVFSDLVLDDRERLWAEVYAKGEAERGTWWIFDGGRAVALISLPPGFELFDVEGDRLAGVRTDDLGVEHIEVYFYSAP